jgi:hypothetical protein
MHGFKRWSAQLVSLVLVAGTAMAGGPRFVTGRPFFTGSLGKAIGWRQTRLLYSTDPGGLGANVNHAAADALVAAAAGVWNQPVASITLAQGGVLAEHVSSANSYLDTSGLNFPADVMASNASSIPLAVLYDTDGSVTDLLLGAGASDPSGCRQNAVTESVDAFDPAGYILHAMLIVNGRCTGPAAEAQLELQYQLERGFGRVLGLAWSQTNDNVYTGNPAANGMEAQNWPLMHPLEIICGSWTYECLPSPFQLRPDDISSLVAVYPVGDQAGVGKQPSLSNALAVSGVISFPTGEGMMGVNVVVRRQLSYSNVSDGWYESSAVSGAIYSRASTSPFVAPVSTPQASFGTQDHNRQGFYRMAYVPMEDGATMENLIVSTEPVNALYFGTHSLGPYAAGNVVPSGISASELAYLNTENSEAIFDFTIGDAAPVCGDGLDGTAGSPVPVPLSGWWNGLICGTGHASYLTAAVLPGRTFTVEVTALDANGFATSSKLMPVIGLFAPTDQPGALPSLDVAANAFESASIGTTALGGATGRLSSVTIGIADQRGDGRPDFPYQSRFFYAGTVEPAQLPTGGGPIRITGQGFRAGNAVSVNGVDVKPLSWTATSITLAAPAMAAVHAADGGAVDVVVSDLGTGASSTMSAALTYTSSVARPNVLQLVSAPAGTTFVGSPAASPFRVQLLGADGTTPVANSPIVFMVQNGGGATLSACTVQPCVVLTDSDGMASTNVTPTVAGSILVQAASGSLTQGATFTAEIQANSIVIWYAPNGSVPVGVDAGPVALIDKASDGSGLVGRSVTYSTTSGTALFSPCGTATCTIPTQGGGSALARVTPTSVGPITVQVADGPVTQTTSFVSTANTDTMRIVGSPAASTVFGNAPGRFVVALFRADGTPDYQQVITFTAPPEVLLYPCKTNACPVPTGWVGQGSAGIDVTVPGTFTVQASFGTVTQSVTFTVTPSVTAMKILSAPSGSLPVGQVAETPFVAQLLQDGATPVANTQVAIAGPQGFVMLGACPYPRPACWLVTDGNGLVTSTVTPIAPGVIDLSAIYNSVTTTTAFTATGLPEVMTITDQPGPAGVWVGDTVNLRVHITGAGGNQPLQYDLLKFYIAGGPFAYSDWPITTVGRQTDNKGDSSEVGVATGPGTITIVVSDGVASQTFVFNARAHANQLRLISAPSSGAASGAVAAIPFSVQVFLPDGVTPAAGHAVAITVASGSAAFSGCGNGPSCSIVAGSNGIISTSVTPLAAGAITLTATESGGQVSATFNAVGVVRPDVLAVAQTPVASLYAGATAATPFAVRVTLADGVTPVAGVSVIFAAGWASTGSVRFGPCDASSCSIVTDANGLASAVVAALSPGAVLLDATAILSTGTPLVSAPLQVLANRWSIGWTGSTPASAVVYLPQGSAVALPLEALGLYDGAPAAYETVNWETSHGFVAVDTDTVTTLAGLSSNQLLLGPLAVDQKAKATACIQPGVCVEFDGVGVAATGLQPVWMSGAAQSVVAPALYAPVVLQIEDVLFHAVAQVRVRIDQTVTACVDATHCNGSVLASQSVDAVSALDGTVVVSPLAGPDPHSATRTSITVTAAAGAAVTTVLNSTP